MCRLSCGEPVRKAELTNSFTPFDKFRATLYHTQCMSVTLLVQHKIASLCLQAVTHLRTHRIEVWARYWRHGHRAQCLPHILQRLTGDGAASQSFCPLGGQCSSRVTRHIGLEGLARQERLSRFGSITLDGAKAGRLLLFLVAFFNLLLDHRNQGLAARATTPV